MILPEAGREAGSFVRLFVDRLLGIPGRSLK
jgi:hypothetical protein